MAKFNGTTNPGRPYRKVADATNVIPDGVNPGQWLRINGKRARLAHANRVVYPNGKDPRFATVSKVGFSLACNKSPRTVLSVGPVADTTKAITELLASIF